MLAAAEEHITGQYVVSKVVLKFFENADREIEKIGVYSVRYGPQRPIGRSRAGLAPDLLRVGTSSAEEHWARTENLLDQAISDVRARGVHASRRSLMTLRMAVALHFARNKVTVGVFDSMWGERSPRLVEGIIERGRTMLTNHYLAHNGRQPSQADLVNLVNEYTSSGTHLNETGAWTRARVEQLFTYLVMGYGTWHRMVVERPTFGSGFLISDNPVATHLNSTGETWTPSRIGWDRADEIATPFAPDVAVCLVRDEVMRATLAIHVSGSVASEERVTRLNLRQARCARNYVFHKPTSDFSGLIAAGLAGSGSNYN